MSVLMIAIVYALTILVPVNMAILMAIQRERKQMRITLRGFWRLYDKRR